MLPVGMPPIGVAPLATDDEEVDVAQAAADRSPTASHSER
jgi:hypothetical protein